MKSVKKLLSHSIKVFTVISLLSLTNSAFSATLPSVIDDFSDANNTNIGMPRISLSDTAAGGQTTTELKITDGVIQVKGQISPPRGQPGWSSLVLPLGPIETPQDASHFSGIRILVKINTGNISISANSSEITNFDYHSAQVVASTDGKFHEVKIPFESMQRMWSEKTALNSKTLNSLSIVAFGVQKSAFDFEIDEVSFY